MKLTPFIKYAIVGTTGTLIDLGSLYIFVEYFGLSVLISAIFSFLLAVVNNFTWNKIWTFENKSKNLRKLFIKFLMVSLVGLILTISMMAIFVNILKIWYMFAKILTSGVVLVWNFLANKYWTFKFKKHIRINNNSLKFDLSIVIPAYNEENRIIDTLEKVDKYIKEKNINAEIIVVDDGSKDSTVNVVNNFIDNHKSVKLLSYSINKGKGYAVKTGVLDAKGSLILFTDADNSTPIEEFEKLSKIMNENQMDIVIGSRYLNNKSVEIRQPLYRIIIGRLGNILINFFLIDGIKDTQCGFKLFTEKSAKEIFQLQKIERFGFDMEALLLARKLGYEIKEVPVKWINSFDSRVRPIRDTINTLKELIYIKINLLSGRYND